ncbi:MAG: helix-turn-helix domain-containing protein, partial [Ktedonobacteraceae bacterium]|nr:helix-turn-helix domain-containing protein [Ktedonobacteraceae bacterium]
MSVKKAAEATPNILLRRARQERGWSQKELADLLGVPQSFMISRWENGTTYPGPEYREKLRSIFGKRCEELGLYKSVSPYPSQIPVIDPAIPVRQPGTSVLVGRDLLLEQIKQSLCSGWNSRFAAMNGLP